VIAVRFLPDAEGELLHEVDYYSNAGSGLGIRFQAAVEASLERAAHHPYGGAPSANGTRNVLVKSFPFSVVYRAGQGELLVVAIAPHRRRPYYWLTRLE
jgi:toxin ParE1/3/4